MNTGCLIGLVLIGLAVIFGTVAGFQIYNVYSNIDCQLDRTQVSSDIETMAENLNKVIMEMEVRAMTEGHAAIILKNPQNDVGQDYQAIVALRDRARSLSEKDPSSVEYSVALDDMRGTIREIEVEACYYAAIRNPLAWLAVNLLIVGIVFGCYILLLNLVQCCGVPY